MCVSQTPSHLAPPRLSANPNDISPSRSKCMQKRERLYTSFDAASRRSLASGVVLPCRTLPIHFRASGHECGRHEEAKPHGRGNRGPRSLARQTAKLTAVSGMATSHRIQKSVLRVMCPSPLLLKNWVPKMDVMALKGTKIRPMTEMRRTLRLFARFTRLSCAMLIWKACSVCQWALSPEALGGLSRYIPNPPCFLSLPGS